MKYSLLPLIAVLFLPLAADELKINGKFNNSVIGAKAPSGWSANIHSGSVATEVVKDDSDFAVFMKAPSKNITFIFSNKMFDAQPGDILDVSAHVKGKGNFRFGYIAYTIDGVFLKTIAGFHIRLTDSFRKQNTELRISEIPGKMLKKIRIILIAASETEVIVKNVDAELKNGADAKAKFHVNGALGCSGENNALPLGWRANGPAKTSILRDGDGFVFSVSSPVKKNTFISF